MNKDLAKENTSDTPQEAKPHLDGAGGSHTHPKNIPYLKAQLAAEQVELRNRFLFVIELWAADRYRYEWLENRTGIPAVRWQNVLLEKQFPTLEMLIVACKNQPQYTYWLMQGDRHKLKNEDKNDANNRLRMKLDYPPQELVDKIMADREWIKQKRRSKKTDKLPPASP